MRPKLPMARMKPIAAGQGAAARRMPSRRRRPQYLIGTRSWSRPVGDSATIVPRGLLDHGRRREDTPRIAVWSFGSEGLDGQHFHIHNFRSLLNGATVPWFSLLRQPRTFEFQARAVDGTIHDFEIQASTARSALDLAKRLCAAKGWQLLQALDSQ